MRKGLSVCLAVEAGRRLCLKSQLSVAFCSGMARCAILGTQTFCMELGVTGPPVYSRMKSGGSSGNTAVRVIDFGRTCLGS